MQENNRSIVFDINCSKNIVFTLKSRKNEILQGKEAISTAVEKISGLEASFFLQGFISSIPRSDK
jgi:hypothetical protein